MISSNMAKQQDLRNILIPGVPIAVVTHRLGFEQQRFAEMSAGSNPAIHQVFQLSV